MNVPSPKTLFLFGFITVLTACGGGGGSSAPTSTGGGSTPTNTPQPTATAASTTPPAPTPTAEPTSTPEPTATAVPTVTPEPTATASPTMTPSPTTTATPVPTGTPIPNAVRPANNTCTPPPATTSGPSEVATEAAFPNLAGISFPLGMVQAPASAGSFWFVINRDGRLFSFDNNATTSELNTSLDIRSRVTTNGEFGLTGLALHPNYPSDNRIFLLYNASANDGRSTLSSFEVNTSTRSINASSETVILSLNQLAPFHNGGDLAFGTDNFLYASFGDTDWGTGELAQDTRNLHGSIIRIDIDGPEPYGIPNDNPFSGGARCNTTANSSGQDCPEIFAYGFRNPWRFSIDSATGDVWVGDVGDAAREEVSRVSLGGNYGWPIMEGSLCGPSNGGCDRSGLQLPIAEYPSSGSSVVGGYVYRGSQSPALVGQYIFGDIYSNQFSSVAANAAPETNETALFRANPGGPAMAQGNDGEIYILAMGDDSSGQNIYRITGSGGVSVTMPENLSETGCFDTATKTSATGVFDYDLIAPLWSDGAAKRRSFAIPNGTEIGVLADGDFDFPTDSILVKHFLNGTTFLETRLMVNHSNGWAGYSYEWNDAQTDAQLLGEEKREDVGPFTHIYPSQAECQACHTEAANNSLGLELAQLNKTNETLNANIVDYLDAAGYLASNQSSATAPKLYALDDDSASLEQRARSYLHSNCASCHRPGGPFASIDLRYSTNFASTNTCDVDPSAGNLGVADAKIIAAGNPDASVLILRMEASEGSGNRMPRLGSLDVDVEAVSLIRDWVAGISSCP